MVDKIVSKYELFMTFKHLPEDIDTLGFYFMRTSTNPIPVPSSLEQAESILPACFETGTIGPKPLTGLEKILTQVYIPMLMLQGIVFIFKKLEQALAVVC